LEWIKELQAFPYDPTPIKGWHFGMTGQRHSDEAKKAIGDANRKYTPEERILKDREQRDAWNVKNPEYQSQYKKGWDEENKQKKKEYAKLYYQRNKEEFARRSKEQWERKNKYKCTPL
jgi:hypothetical protein